MNKIFKKFGVVLCSITLAIASFFLPMKNYNKNLVASADSVDTIYSFTGSDLIFLPILRVSSINYTGVITAYFRASFSVSGNNVTVQPGLTYVDVNENSNNISQHSMSLLNYNYNPINNITLSLGSNAGNYFRYSSYTTFFDTSVSSAFNGNVIGVHLYYEINSSSSYINSFFIEYFNSANEFIKFEFYVPKNFDYVDRYYYFSSNFSDSDIYISGYQQGLVDNQQDIYNNGYNAGQSAGYNAGRNDGIASANDYSFIGLIGSVVDVPFQTFKGALNYEILGINLFNLFTALLTLGLILFVVKLILGGK